jgi:hypothetical protein
MSGRERFRAEIADSAASAGSIVVGLNVLEDRLSHEHRGQEALAVHGFDFQRVEQTLGTRVVVAIPSAAHATQQAVLIEQCLVSGEVVLAPAVRVHGQTLACVLAPTRQHER